MQTSGVNEHEPPVAERFIRVIKERLRLSINTQQYKVPVKLLQYAIYKPIQDLDNTPNSKTIKVTPNQIVTGVKVDYKYDITYPWGTIVDVKKPKTNSKNQSRIETGILIVKSPTSRDTKVIILRYGKLLAPRNRRTLWLKRDIEETVKQLNNLATKELVEIRTGKLDRLPEILNMKEYK